MRIATNSLKASILAGALAGVFFTTGCAVHAGYYNDPYYHDHHPRHDEVVYYNQWEHDTHREHRDLNRRNDAEQKEYWDWRHSHH